MQFFIANIVVIPERNALNLKYFLHETRQKYMPESLKRAHIHIWIDKYFPVYFRIARNINVQSDQKMSTLSRKKHSEHGVRITLIVIRQAVKRPTQYLFEVPYFGAHLNLKEQ